MSAPGTNPSTTLITNTGQAAAWNGPEGANWARYTSRRAGQGDLVVPVLDALALAPEDRVLDVGCGTGDLALAAARLASAGRVVGIDLSNVMVDRANAQAAELGMAHVEVVMGDAQVHPFPTASFDAVASHFGVMFFGDPAAAFANLARATALGGRLAFVVPQAMHRCQWYAVPIEAVTGVPPTPASAPSVMFSLADADLVTALLTEAGWTDVRLEPLAADLWFGADPAEAAEAYLGAGPVRAALERDPSISEEQARERLTEAMAPYASASGVEIPGLHWLVTARRR